MFARSLYKDIPQKWFFSVTYIGISLPGKIFTIEEYFIPGRNYIAFKNPELNKIYVIDDVLYFSWEYDQSKFIPSKYHNLSVFKTLLNYI